MRIVFLMVFFIFNFSYADVSYKLEKTKLDNFSSDGCPGGTFEVFIEKFIFDENIQKKYTHEFLTKLWIEVAGVVEPTPYIRTFHKSEVAYPVVPSFDQIKSKKLISKIKNKENVFLLYAENSGYRVKYIFMQGSCWYLVAVEDLSI